MSLENLLPRPDRMSQNVRLHFNLEPFRPFNDAFSDMIIVLRLFVGEALGVVAQCITKSFDYQA